MDSACKTVVRVITVISPTTSVLNVSPTVLHAPMDLPVMFVPLTTLLITILKLVTLNVTQIHMPTSLQALLFVKPVTIRVLLALELPLITVYHARTILILTIRTNVFPTVVSVCIQTKKENVKIVLRIACTVLPKPTVSSVITNSKSIRTLA